jgi:hypothetical protein
MNVQTFPVTHPIRCEADAINTALDLRTEEIKNRIRSQSLIGRVSIIALKIIGLAASLVTIASVPLAAFLFVAKPLVIAAAAFALAITCLGLGMLLDPRSTAESIVKDHWKTLFEALCKGNGPEIIDKCTQLAQKKELRPGPYEKCLGGLNPAEVDPFFHKTCMVGNLLIAMELLEKNDHEGAKSHANMALSHYETSNFSLELERFGKAIIDNPEDILRLMKKHQISCNTHSLDVLIVKLRSAENSVVA